MFYFTKLISRKLAPKPREDNLIYGNVISRYLSILIDLFLLMVLFKTYQFCYSHTILLLFDNVDLVLLKKAQFGLKMTPEEIQVFEKFKIQYLIMNFSQLILLPFYFCMPWYYLSGSFGQILLGLRIVNDINGRTLSCKKVIQRFFASITTIGTLMIGFLWSFIDKKRQSFHDKIVHTIIVTKRSLKKQEMYDPKYDIFDNCIYPSLKKCFSTLKNKYDLYRSDGKI